MEFFELALPSIWVLSTFYLGTKEAAMRLGLYLLPLSAAWWPMPKPQLPMDVCFFGYIEVDHALWVS